MSDRTRFVEDPNVGFGSALIAGGLEAADHGVRGLSKIQLHIFWHGRDTVDLTVLERDIVHSLERESVKHDNLAGF